MSVDLEKILRPVDTPMKPYEPKYMMLASGDAVVDETFTLPVGNRTFEIDNDYTQAGTYTVTETLPLDWVASTPRFILSEISRVDRPSMYFHSSTSP